MKIDMHTHLMPKHLPDWPAQFGYGGFIRLDHHRAGFARMMQGDTFFREVAENCWNAELRIAEYAAQLIGAGAYLGLCRSKSAVFRHKYAC